MRGQFLRVIRPEGVTVSRYNVEGAVTNISSPEGSISYEYDPVAGYLTRVYTTSKLTNRQYVSCQLLSTL